jgi:protein-disulfide isomerase
MTCRIILPPGLRGSSQLVVSQPALLVSVGRLFARGRDSSVEVRMSYSNAGSDRLTKNARREAARDKAKTLRDQQRKKDKRSRFLVQGGVIIVALAIVAVVVLVVQGSVRAPEAGPSNMASDGIMIGQGLVAVQTAAIAAGATPVANAVDETSDVLAIQIFVDYMCPVCGAFEQTNGEQIATWVNNGAVTVEIFPFAILDRASQGTMYSTRAANAAACVANYSPNQFFDFNRLMFDTSTQPAEGSTGLSDEEIIAVTEQANVERAGNVATCITDQRFAGWVLDAHDRNLAGPIAAPGLTTVNSTPTVLVNGVQYTGLPNDADAFSAFVLQAANAKFNDNVTSTPTPTP